MRQRAQPRERGEASVEEIGLLMAGTGAGPGTGTGRTTGQAMDADEAVNTDAGST